MKKRILIISDYIDRDLGGIESYIYNIKNLLTNNGFEVKNIGYRIGKSRFKRLFFLFLSFFNLHGYFFIKKEIKKFKPDIIRFHSVARAFGPLSLLSIKNFKGKKIIMYHDLGFFHPFADKVYKEDQLVLPFNFFNWFNSLKFLESLNLLYFIYGIIKFFKISFLRKFLLRYIDIHLVPSDFMVSILSNRGVKREKIKVLSHFIKSDEKR